MKMNARLSTIAGGLLAVLAIILGVAGACYGSTLPDVPSAGPRNFANPIYSTLIATGIAAWVAAILILHRAWRTRWGASRTAWWAAAGLISTPLTLWSSVLLMSVAHGWLVLVAGTLLLFTPLCLAIGVAASVALIVTTRRSSALATQATEHRDPPAAPNR